MTRQNTGAYECTCGESVVLTDDETHHIAWIQRKFGYTRSADVINRLKDCCSRPDYANVGGFSRDTPLYDEGAHL